MQISKELHTTMSRPFYSDGKKAKMCRSSASSSSLSHFFPRDFSGTIADSDIINTPLKPFYQQMCLLGVSLSLLLIFGIKSPENPHFGG